MAFAWSISALFYKFYKKVDIGQVKGFTKFLVKTLVNGPDFY